MTDIFDATVATYRDEAGAAAFVAKERKYETGRSFQHYQIWEGVALEGLRVLDVGCGFGRDVGELRRRGAEAYGCDVSEALLAVAREQVGDYFAEYDLRSWQELPFQVQKGVGWDLIWCCAVLVHVPRAELAGFLTRLWGELAAGGRLVIVAKEGEGEVVSRNLGERLPRVMVFYRLQEILEILEPLGGVVEIGESEHSVTPFGDRMLGLRIRKA